MGSISALGLFVTVGPIAAIGVTVFVLLFILAMEQPRMAFYAVIAIQMVMPVYMVIPSVGFLPNLPISMLPLGVVLTLCLLANMLNPQRANIGNDGRVLMLVLYLFAIISLASLADEMSSRESFLLWIRAEAIPLSFFWISIRLLHTADDVQKLFYVLMFAGVCISGFAMFEFLMGRNILIEKLIMSTDSSMQETMSSFYHTAEAISQMGSSIYRCFSVFINPIEFGSFMTMVFPFPLVAVKLVSGKRRWLYGFIASVCFLGVLLSFSRGPILTSVLQIMGLALLLRPPRRLVVGSVLAMVLAISLAWPLIGDSITSRFKEKDNVTLRFILWEIGLHLVADNPVLGVGLGNFSSYQKKAERDYRVGPIVEEGNIDNIATVDNTYIQLAAETGLLGFGSFLSVMLVFFALTIKLYRRSLQNSDSQLQALVLGSGFGVFGYYFNALTYTAVGFFVVTPILFLFFSIVIILERSLNSNGLTSRLQRCA